MKRYVLALLALLGLVAQAAPVQARVCGLGTAQVVVVDRSQGRALAAQSVASEAPVAQGEKAVRDCAAPRADRKKPVYIPTVQLKADRARE